MFVQKNKQSVTHETEIRVERPYVCTPHRRQGIFEENQSSILFISFTPFLPRLSFETELPTTSTPFESLTHRNYLFSSEEKGVDKEGVLREDVRGLRHNVVGDPEGNDGYP